MNDLIIIGGGPAGLTAAVYAIRKRLNVLLLSKYLVAKPTIALPCLGSRTTRSSKAWRSSTSSARNWSTSILPVDMEVVEQVERKADHFVITTKSGMLLEAKAVILATGTRQVRMNVPGEKEYTMKGLLLRAFVCAALYRQIRFGDR